jgi:HK97 family phage portal protein
MSIFSKFFGSKPKTEPTPVVSSSASTTTPIVQKVTHAQKELVTAYADGGNNLAKSKEENYLSTSELIYSCVDYISKAASQATPLLYTVNPKTKERKPVKDKRLDAWIRMPNPYWTWNDLIEVTIQGILLGGGSYLTHEMAQGSYETWFLGPPSSVNIIPDKSKYIKGYIYNDKIPYKPEEVCYIKNPSLNNAYYGQPAVKPLLDTLLLEAESIDELRTFYKGSTILAGVLKSELPLTPEQIEDLREQFNSLYGAGGKFKRGTAVLPAKMDYKQIQASPRESMLLDSMEISETRVLRVFKLNALALGGEHTATSHPQELMKSIFNTAVRPYLYKIEAQMTLFLQKKFKNPDLIFEFDFDKIVELETSLDTKSTAAKTLYSTGVATLNESRDLLGLPKLNTEYADNNVLASFLFGENFTYIQELTPEGRKAVQNAANTGNNPAGDAGSTDPQGGTADTASGNNNNESNNNE